MAVGGHWRFVIALGHLSERLLSVAPPVGDCGEVAYGTLGAWTRGQDERDASECVILPVPLPLTMTGATVHGRARDGNG